MGPTGETFAEELAREALESLRFNWGEAYDIVRSDGAWLAHRRDGLGATLRAAGPRDLLTAIKQDYEGRPVPRGEHPYPQDGST